MSTKRVSRTIMERLLTGLSSACVLAALTGCGIGPAAPASPDEPHTVHLQGRAHGGQFPVSGGSILLYAAGTGGNGSQSNPMLLLPKTTDANGFFNITLDYVCLNSTDQIYIVIQGGNPGLPVVQGSPTPSNPALVMMAALGACSGVPNLPYIWINEVTTVAAAWALAPFITDYAHIGATSTNTIGLANAFLNAGLIANTTNGQNATLPSTQTTETDKVNALANAIGACVNSDGTTGCQALFAAATPPGGVAPTDTLTAAVNIVRNPGNNVTDVFNASSAFTLFPTAYTQAPNDWTLSLTTTGNGLASPLSLGIDVDGNVWVGNYASPISAFTPQGAAIGAYGTGQLSEVFGLAVDSNNDIWITQEENPHHYPTRGSVSKYHGVTSGQTGTLVGQYYDQTIQFPASIAGDNFGNMFIANYGNSTADVYNTSGGLYSFTANGNNYTTGGLGSLDAAFPVVIIPDNASTATFPGGFWLANQGDDTVTHLDSMGNLISRPECCNGANGIALDAFGNAWVSNYYGSSVSEVSDAPGTTAGNVLIDNTTNGGLTYPAGNAVDGAQNVWVTNYRGASLTYLAGNSNASPAGTGLSPDTGFGLDANLLLPYAVALDASGNVWVTNYANNDLVMFFGLGAPTKTPLLPLPTAP